MPNRKNVMTGMPKGGVAGYLFRAPLGTAIPTNETTALNAAFKDQGFVHEDGVERTINKAFEVIRDMRGDEVLKVRTEHGVQVTFSLLETLNGETATTVYGASAVTVTAATVSSGTKVAIAYKGEDVADSAWVLELALGSKAKRIIFPVASLTTEEQTTTLTGKEAATFPVTLTLYPDATGTYFYEYSDDGVFSA